MHFLGDQALVFKDFLLDVNRGEWYSETSLLNILVQISHATLGLWS